MGAEPAIEEERREVFKDWTLMCARRTKSDAEGGTTRACFVHTMVELERGGFVSIGLRANPSASGYVIVLSVPPDAAEEAGIRFVIDNGSIFGAKFSDCDARRCVVGSPIDQDLLTAMKSGTIMTIAYRTGDEVVSHGMSLSGLTRALEALDRAR